MPSNKALESKKQIVQGLIEEFKSAQTLLVADYRGLTVEQDTEMRTALRKEGIIYKVVKNTLATFAAKEAGLESLNPLFEGPTAIAYSKSDVVAPAKVLQKYADKIETFSIKGGVMEKKAISIQDVKALSLIPSKEILYSQIVCGIASPITGLAMILNAIAEKGNEAGTDNVSALAVSA
ncbi:MAG: 50S ribosomal protein L10 [Saccharofermentanales bacterium]